MKRRLAIIGAIAVILMLWLIIPIVDVRDG